MANEDRKEDKLLFRSVRFLNCEQVSLPLIFLLVFLFSIAIAPAAYAANGDFGNSDYTDIGKDSNPYLIDDEADLKAFRDIVNGDNGQEQNLSASARLTNDITLTGESWTPIANYSYDNQNIQYAGTFDGGGYTIYNLLVYDDNAGFFGCVGENGTVKNLTIANDGTVSGNYSGGIVAYNYYGTVQNCVNSATVRSSNTISGGIVAYNYYGTVQNCINLGSVYNGGISGGGIVGYNNGGTVQNCAWLSGLGGNVSNGVGNDGSHTGATEIDNEKLGNIVMTLTASIDTQSVYTGETATITFSTSPASPEGVFDSTTGALRGGVTIEFGTEGVAKAAEYDGDGTITVTGLSEGETTITVKAMFYATDLSTLSNGQPSYLGEGEGTELTFTFNLTVLTEQDEDNSTTKSRGPGGCNAGIGALALLALIPLAMRRKR